jgi:hypothetical protein
MANSMRKNSVKAPNKKTDNKKTNQYVNSASQMPPEKTNEIYRSVRYKADVKTMVVRTEIGYDLVFDLEPQIRVSPYSQTKEGTPKFQSSIVWTLRGVRPKGTSMKVPEIKEMIKDRDLLPLDMDWDKAQIGFVYSNARDPNNHRWWIEALKPGAKMGEFKSVLSEYTLDVASTAPIGSRSWFDGIHHGRFTFDKDNIESIRETAEGKVMITGNGKGKIGSIKGNVDIPDECKAFRLRFDIRKNVWYTEMLDETGKVLQMLTSKNVMCDAKFKGLTVRVPTDPNRPKVSGMVNISDVDVIKHDDQLIMIKGK